MSQIVRVCPNKGYKPKERQIMNKKSYESIVSMNHINKYAERREKHIIGSNKENMRTLEVRKHVKRTERFKYIS